MIVTYSLDNLVYEPLCFVDLLFRVCHDQAMEVLVLVAGVSSVRFALALLDRALATDCDLGARLCLHLFERVTTRTDE